LSRVRREVTSKSEEEEERTMKENPTAGERTADETIEVTVVLIEHASAPAVSTVSTVPSVPSVSTTVSSVPSSSPAVANQTEIVRQHVQSKRRCTVFIRDVQNHPRDKCPKRERVIVDVISVIVIESIPVRVITHAPGA